MKRNILHRSCLLMFAAGMMLVSCSDWLDVRPKSEILADLHFERESGYKDQLTGVYTKMSTMAMYGQNMSFGLMSVLSQDYDLRANGMYRYAAEYDYKEVTTKLIVDSIWSSTYNCIANLNIMLEYIDKADKNIFSDNNYALYKGEALGLRAFLHLDMLRIYSPSVARNASAMGVPYVTTYGKVITPQKSVTETLDLIIADLLESVELLKVDPFLDKVNVLFADRRARAIYFNYYAAIGTLARAYMYKGDKANALKYAEIIIAEENDPMQNNFGWTSYTALETTYEYECNRIFSGETLFYLNIRDFDNIVKYYFTSAAGRNTLTPSEEKADVIFEKTSKGYGNDYRMLKGFAYDGDSKYFWKYHQYEGGKHNDIMPMIRKSESFYIAAEILKDSDPARAVQLLNQVRAARNLKNFALPVTLNASQIQEEIYKEYRKEFLGEGQMFYYYKRQNATYIEGAAINANDKVYVLPMPDNEIEFGSRN